MYAQLFHRSRWGIFSIVLVLAILTLGWMQVMPISQRFYNFQELLRSIGQLTALLGFGMIAINLILSGRFKWLESFFGGMDKMYILHHILGGIGFIFVLLHPLFIAGAYYIDSPLAASRILLPGPSLYKNLGNASLVMFMTLIALTLFIKLPYEIWHKTHKVMGVAFLLGAVHAYFTGGSLSSSWLLKISVLGLTSLALAVYLYRTIFGRWLVSRYRYKISSINKLNQEVTQIILSTKGERLRFTPGQFAFFTFTKKNGSTETHPFSISSSNHAKELIITTKALGDFTRDVSSLKIGSVVWVEGPFGRFLTKTSDNQVWIAGGIGVTPFASRIFSGLENYKQIDFFYTASEASEMVYVKELINQSKKFKQLKVHFHASKEKGRLTAETVKEKVGNLKKTVYHLCGPLPMMQSMRQQLLHAGVSDEQIFSEQFSIDERA
jgi:predicted ferric reductase